MAKCSECGFFAFRNITTRELVEVDERFREEGFTPISNGIYPWENVPICSAGAVHLQQALRTYLEKNPPGPGYISQSLTEWGFAEVQEFSKKERACDESTVYLPGPQS